MLYLYTTQRLVSYVGTDEDLFDLLYTDVLKYNAIGKVIIYGDINARCGNLSDYTDYNFNDRDDVDDILFTGEEHDVKQRTSEDKPLWQKAYRPLYSK